jgi:hypothetical protein
VPRPADGPARTDTALFGHIAYKLEGMRLADLDQWAEGVGIEVDAEALRRAPAKSARLAERPGRERALRPGLRIDWRALDFFVALVRLRIASAGAVDQLESARGVIDVFSLEADREALVVVVYERRHDREALELKLAEFGQVLAWESVQDHRPGAAISTFRAFAREAAMREGLLLP